MDLKTLDYMSERVNRANVLLANISKRKEALGVVLSNLDDDSATLNIYVHTNQRQKALSDGKSGLIPSRVMFIELAQPIIDILNKEIAGLEKELAEI